MKQILGLLLILLLTVGSAWAQPLVELKTSLGSIRIELDAEQAPQTVENFLAYVDSNFYDGTIFHRVIDGFMIQGGGYSTSLQRRETRAPIVNEADNGLQNRRGTIAMARSRAIDSATSQFFINLVDNDFLNHRGPTPQAFGYAVFGRVVAGMEVVDQIGRQKTLVKSPLFKDFPEQQMIIESVRRVDQD